MTVRIFRFLSRKRNKRIFHPVGETFGGKILLDGFSKEIFGDNVPAEADVIVRMSRAFDIPGIKWDFYGIALRIQFKDRYQDLLFASAGSSSVSKYFFKPAFARISDTFSMVLPYKMRKTRYLFWVKLDKKPLRINEKLRLGPDTALFLQYSRIVGSRRNIGTIYLGSKLPQSINRDIRYNPWHTFDNLRPAGLINRLRKHAYSQSQIGRSG